MSRRSALGIPWVYLGRAAAYPNSPQKRAAPCALSPLPSPQRSAIISRKIPGRLQPLVDDGLIDEVAYQLKSGKEADVYAVWCNGVLRCAKIYKEATKRSFKQAVQYREGRTVRDSRRSRAMAKSSRFGRKEHEEAWLNAEVDALYRLDAAGVRVPRPYGFMDGVLLMEMITDGEGNAAPRLNDVSVTPAEALLYHRKLMNDIVLMLSAGLVHGDLSEFNVLLADDGPVIIDLPQAVNAAGNNSAAAMLLRDVQNMNDYFGMYAPELLQAQFGPEIWTLYTSGALIPGIELTGVVAADQTPVDLSDLLEVVADVKAEHAIREAGRVAAEQGDAE